MAGIRTQALSQLARWARLPTGSADAVDQLRQQLQSIGIELDDWRGIRLAERLLGLAEDLHANIGDEPEYVKRARVNYVLARLCAHLETRMANDVVQHNLRSLQQTKHKKADA